MIFVSNEFPRFCPGCGRDLTDDAPHRGAFDSGRAFTCSGCGAQWGYSPTVYVISAAISGGGEAVLWRDAR